MIFSQYQQAFYVHNDSQFHEIKARFNLVREDWIEDIATGDVWLDGEYQQQQSVAHLRFCYKFPVEFEVLTYVSGPHWHQSKEAFKEGRPFLSHIGIHMNPEDVAPWSVFPSQRMMTVMHTNQYLNKKKRKFLYEIYSAQQNGLGVDMKYIWRREGER